ncbi:MAG: hypothetical protein V3W50_05500 [Thermoanaerobaculia bacterium]
MTGKFRLFTALLVSVATLAAIPADAVTFASVEPIPNEDVVGAAVLDNILSISYSDRERWATTLIDCGVVQGVIDALASDDTITTINSANTTFGVAAGGFEGQTNPSFVFTIVDTGVNTASTNDIETLVNALGYVLSQGGTAHFNPEDQRAYDFFLRYITISFMPGPLEGEEAQEFFEHVGTIDVDLFSGLFAGFTQIGDSMLFLQPAVSQLQFISGQFVAAETFAGAEYDQINNGGHPTTAKAGVAFRGNDWIAQPLGDGYLENIDQDPFADLGDLDNLAELRADHLQFVADLDEAIMDGKESHKFKCVK